MRNSDVNSTQTGYFIELLVIMKIKNIQKEKLECAKFHGWEFFPKDSIPISERQKLTKKKKKYP